ncbi:GTA-gp10 family protein [Caulobacter segnis]|uniref:GTA-gp10 family protein n=1 Tax=Caulobacter segnis TaxID=88688 RepID=UPI001CC05020|nr:GTA-gp10 family protein [Caulobacter segnis]UAL09565.1 gene transfer agent family protein [Caulobacter segnis]
MPPPNPARGEVAVTIAGAPRRLCLTLGALARIEAALGLSDWSQLPERIATLSAGELSAILAALLDGGGEDPAIAARATVPEAASALAAALAACA